jgi:hypothetical protein
VKFAGALDCALWLEVPKMRRADGLATSSGIITFRSVSSCAIEIHERSTEQSKHCGECGCNDGATGVELLFLDVSMSLAELQMQCTSVEFESRPVPDGYLDTSVGNHVVNPRCSRSRDMRVQASIQRAARCRISDIKSIFTSILGMHLPFLDPLHDYRRPLSARTPKQPKQPKRLALTGFSTVSFQRCVFMLPSASAMGLSIWRQRISHASEGSRNIEAKHDPLTMNPSTGCEGPHESLCTGDASLKLP